MLQEIRMTEAVFQFKAIARKLNRQEQKAEFEEKNPPIPDTSMYGWPYGVAVSVTSDSYTPPEWLLNQVPLSDLMGSTEAGRVTGGLSPAVRAFVDGWEYDETLRMWRKYEI
jgi:hypothetical protein